MKNFLPFIIAVGGIFGCQMEEKPKKVDNRENATGNKIQYAPTYVVDQNLKWMDRVNSNSDSLQILYTPNAIKINQQGEIFRGPTVIADRVRSNNFMVDSIFSSEVVMANSSNTYEYEIGHFWTSNNKSYDHLIIWNLGSKPKQRELEFIAESTSTKAYLEEINNRRADWMTICNNHNAKKLVEHLYTDNAIYYNHKPPMVGKTMITQEYQYMNKDDYQLMLEPIFFQSVTNELAFEIGQCSGNYNGKYILIWQKNAIGEWRILMDSNI